MSTGTPSEEISRFVEDVGMWFEQMGIPRMAGKVYGWLLVCDPPEQNAQQIARAVGGSKGSISTTTRLLIQFGLIERFGVPGQRSAAFRIRPNGWFVWIQHEMNQIRVMRDLADRGLALLKSKPPEKRQRVKEVSELFSYLIHDQSEVMERIEKWQKKKKA